VTSKRPPGTRETELDGIERALQSQAGFLAASAHWDDGPSAESVEARRSDLRMTCAEYVEAYDRHELAAADKHAEECDGCAGCGRSPA
jgi:hypothetical protein